MLRGAVFTSVPGLTAVVLHCIRFPISGSLDALIAGATYSLSILALGPVAFLHRSVLADIGRSAFVASIAGLSAVLSLLLASSPNWPFTDIGFVLTWSMGVAVLGLAFLRVSTFETGASTAPKQYPASGMSRRALAVHLSVPAALTLGAFTVAVGREPIGVEMIAIHVLGSYFLYAAPHLVWAVVAPLAKASRAVWHAGFIASSVALAVIASFWFWPPDPSGLPLQWMLYWPLAAVLQLVVAGGTAVYQRAKRVTDPPSATDA
jgi:hypothetical protein